MLEDISTLIAAHSAREATAGRILGKILLGALGDGFTRRDILQHGWSGLTRPEAVGAGLNLLVERNTLAVVNVARGGRNKTVYRLAQKATGISGRD